MFNLGHSLMARMLQNENVLNYFYLGSFSVSLWVSLIQARFANLLTGMMGTKTDKIFAHKELAHININ